MDLVYNSEHKHDQYEMLSVQVWMTVALLDLRNQQPSPVAESEALQGATFEPCCWKLSRSYLLLFSIFPFQLPEGGLSQIS